MTTSQGNGENGGENEPETELDRALALAEAGAEEGAETDAEQGSREGDARAQAFYDAFLNARLYVPTASDDTDLPDDTVSLLVADIEGEGIVPDREPLFVRFRTDHALAVCRGRVLNGAPDDIGFRHHEGFHELGNRDIGVESG